MEVLTGEEERVREVGEEGARIGRDTVAAI